MTTLFPTKSSNSERLFLVIPRKMQDCHNFASVFGRLGKNIFYQFPKMVSSHYHQDKWNLNTCIFTIRTSNRMVLSAINDKFDEW